MRDRRRRGSRLRSVLVFIAMPLKYGLGLPQMVKVLGMAHGVLFMAFVIALALAMVAQKWSVTRAIVLLVASMVPLGAVWIERRPMPYHRKKQ